jgi:hypothetical protein
MIHSMNCMYISTKLSERTRDPALPVMNCRVTGDPMHLHAIDLRTRTLDRTPVPRGGKKRKICWRFDAYSYDEFADTCT